jgi:hypothetical protein
MTEQTNENAVQPAAASRDAPAARVAYFALATGGAFALVAIARHFSGAFASIDPATIIERHGPALFGIPASAATAFILVALVRALDGPIALDLLGLKTEGAGATAIIWIAVFLAISLSFRALW